MRVEFAGDMPIATGKYIAGAEVPPELVPVFHEDWGRLRFVDGKMVDGAVFAAFYIDEVGRKHATKTRGATLLRCRYYDELLRDGDRWRVATEEELRHRAERVEWANTRARRDALLSESDWTQLPDAPLGNPQRREWADYRQDLRNITRDFASPADVVWPRKPGATDADF